jgi:hypothetical protein
VPIFIPTQVSSSPTFESTPTEIPNKTPSSVSAISYDDAMPPQIANSDSLSANLPSSKSRGDESASIDPNLWQAVERMQDDMQEAFEKNHSENELAAKVVAGTGLSLTAGIVVWVMRTGTLLASLLSFLPVWKSVDPLSILVAKTKKDDKKETEVDEDSVLKSKDSADELFNQSDLKRKA